MRNFHQRICFPFIKHILVIINTPAFIFLVIYCYLVTVFNQFWDWVGNHCPETLSMDNCQGCFDYSGAFKEFPLFRSALLYSTLLYSALV